MIGYKARGLSQGLTLKEPYPAKGGFVLGYTHQSPREDPLRLRPLRGPPKGGFAYPCPGEGGP
ncbi:hypothetical protein E2562_018975 [Oryza meyeriana var. granulata]|uniref:Uncharacterized protein n=1 Tax=Oryza meyeriana var. granulata TaxID=110450 RepID=A0A6G1DJT5_9ORYZ|nr:hypothetical protein E2562_018975 [Oryza meyeriana var. granulata]